MTSITIGANTYNLCQMPRWPGFADIEIAMNDTVAVVTSPFTRQEQTQDIAGGDFWDATITLPPMTVLQAKAWRGFLAELRGRLNVFQAADPTMAQIAGNPQGIPVVDSTNPANNLPMTWALTTRGWESSAFRLLLPGDAFQIGYRLHMVCETVNSDVNGDATIVIFPSLRETPADGSPLNLNKPQGLFRLISNRRAIQASPSRLTTFSMKFAEAK